LIFWLLTRQTACPYSICAAAIEGKRAVARRLFTRFIITKMQPRFIITKMQPFHDKLQTDSQETENKAGNTNFTRNDTGKEMQYNEYSK